MVCSVASSRGELGHFTLNFISKPFDQPWLFAQSAVAYSAKMQLCDAPPSHFVKMSSGRLCGSLPNFSFGDDAFRKPAMEFRASSDACFSFKYQAIFPFPSPPLMGLKTLLSIHCLAKSAKSTFLDETSTATTEPVEKDRDTLAVKEPSRRPSVPVKKVPRPKNQEPSKTCLSKRLSRQRAALRVSSPEFCSAMAKLEHLGVAGPAVFRYIEHATLADITVDSIVSSISSLMGIARVDWNEAIAMLSKLPCLLKAEPLKIKAMVTFLIELGMDQEDYSKLLALHPALLEYNLDEMRLIVDYLNSVGIMTEEFPSILMGRPQVFSNKVEDVQYVIGCLLRANVPSKDLPRILTKVPELFSPITRKNLKSRIEFFKQVGLDGKALGRGIARRPNLLNFDLEIMEHTYQYLSEFLTPSDILKLIRRFAEVLLLDPKRKMEPMVNHLLNLGVKRSSLGKVLLRRPQLLGYTVAGVERTLQFLRELGVKEDLLGKLISISPQVLTLNCEEKLKPVVEFLRSIGLDEEGDMERMLVRNAQILCCSIDKNIIPKITFLRSMGLTNEDVIRIMVLFPSLFGQSIESQLAPKHYYLVEIMKRSPQEIVQFPQYFGYSLEKRIKPRFERLAAKGIYNVSLPSMLVCVEDEFVQRYLVGSPPSPRAAYTLRKIPRKSKYAHL